MAVEDVASVKNQLIAKYGPNACDGACGAFKITSTVAWNLRADGWGLIKSTGNGCENTHGKFRADTIMKQDGTVIDLLLRSENNEGQVSPAVSPDSYNVPAWISTGAQPPSNWTAPWDPGLLDGTVPPVEQPPSGGGNSNFEQNVMVALTGLYKRDDERKEQIAQLSQQVEQLSNLVKTMHYVLTIFGAKGDVAPRP